MDANNASVGPPKLVYILGLGHSGSTLLEMLLSSHPRLLGLGEVASLLTRGMRERHLSGPWPSPCSCGVLARDCPVWKPTLDQLQPDGPESSLDVLVADLVGRATQVTGKDILIDSSKTWHALDAWRARAARWGWL
ncbi:MAG: hypothetical protein KC492_10375, partial [Myxococcales bacterium]|nr:hypothetical protein [Myxococcales bacterium]